MERIKKQFSSAVTREFKGHSKKIHSCCWNLDGRNLATGSLDQTIRIFSIDKSSQSNASNGKSVELKGHTGDIEQLVWDPTHSEKLASTSADKTVRLWDIRTPKQATHIINTGGENLNITWSSNGRYIATGNKDDVLTFIDIRGGTNGSNSPYIMKTITSDFEINEMRFSYGNEMLFMTTGSGSIRVLGFPDCELLLELPAHTSSAYCIDFDPRGRYFAVGSADALVSIWDVEDLICIQTLGRLDWPVRCLSWSYDGELVASGSDDLVIDISHASSGQHIVNIPTLSGTNSLAWHPTRHLLAYASEDLTVRLWGFAE